MGIPQLKTCSSVLVMVILIVANGLYRETKANAEPELLTELRFAFNVGLYFWGWLLLCFLWQPSLFLFTFPVAFQFRLPGHPTPDGMNCSDLQPSNQSQRSSGSHRDTAQGSAVTMGCVAAASRNYGLSN